MYPQEKGSPHPSPPRRVRPYVISVFRKRALERSGLGGSGHGRILVMLLLPTLVLLLWILLFLLRIL